MGFDAYEHLWINGPYFSGFCNSKGYVGCEQGVAWVVLSPGRITENGVFELLKGFLQGFKGICSVFYKGLHRAVLGGSWVVISGVISPGIWVVSIVYPTSTPTYNYS